LSIIVEKGRRFKSPRKDQRRTEKEEEATVPEKKGAL